MTFPRRLRLSIAALSSALAIVAVPASAGLRDRFPVQGPVGGEALSSSGTLVATGATPLTAPISAQSFVVADLKTGDVLAARNPHGRYLPASTLKTLTAVALIPELDLRGVHVAVREDVGIEGSKVGLVSGERYTVDTLMKAMLVVSGNDAAHSLATAAGGMPRATQLLNATASRLQARDTRAVNTSGLDAPGQVTSAYDLALITRAGMRLPEYRRYVGMLRSEVNAPGGRFFEIYNHNKMLTRYAGTNGGKTGYTVKARHCYVVTASRAGRDLVVTLLKSERHYEDATRLLDWGFSAAGRATPVGRLVEPLSPAPPPRGAVVQGADRSRVEPQQATEARPVRVAASSGDDDRRLPVHPAIGGGALVGVALVGGAVRRRRRRRRLYGTPSLSLRLPVR